MYFNTLKLYYLFEYVHFLLDSFTVVNGLTNVRLKFQKSIDILFQFCYYNREVSAMNLSYSDYLFMVDMWLKYKKRHNIHIELKREISDRERLNRLKKRRKYRGKPVNHPVVLKLSPKTLKRLQSRFEKPYIPFQVAEEKERCLDVYKEKD